MYFDMDHEETWELLEKDECFVCDRHRYTMIFYERRPEGNQNVIDPNHNPDLTEVVNFTNYDQIREIRECLTSQELVENDSTPIIWGTVNKGGFARKLKMMRADMFSLLCIS
mmetsp:Transcript_38821/g.59019  ORF Transcript_38821/g.59019 Transcript_38821/m.59019 type:complete len:112 (-) Transcript_38821:488-823(-)